MPGQEVSVSTAILPGPLPTATGSGRYLNGETVMAIGGGICQVSPQLQRGEVLEHGLVLKRHPHSMPVHYLPLGLDAAISSGSKDLRFRNNYSAPVIVLQAYGREKFHHQCPGGIMIKRTQLQALGKNTGSLSAKHTSPLIRTARK